MTLSSFGGSPIDTNCASNSNRPLSSSEESQSRSPPYDTLSGLFPLIQSHDLLSPDPQQGLSGRTSANSSAMNSPNPSRSPSPLPRFYSSSDTDSDEPVSPLLLDSYPSPYLRDGPPRWWQLRQRPRRGPRRPSRWGFRPVVRVLRRVFRHPFFPKHPTTIVRLIILCACVRLRALSTASFSSVFLCIGAFNNFPFDPPVES